MRYDPASHHRRSIRLKGYDYAQPGVYFVTIVAQDRSCVFGEITGGVVHPSHAGRMVQAVWDELTVFYPGVLVDEFVVMPNHLHGIIVLAGRISAPVPVRAARGACLKMHKQINRRHGNQTGQHYALRCRERRWRF